MRFTSMTHPGGQKLNKDCFDKVCRNGVYCFVMSDGEGVGGEEASEIVVKAVIKAFEKQPLVTEQTAEECIVAAQAAVKDHMELNPWLECMTATVAILITDGKNSICAHIGDTRVYTLNKGSIELITNAHTEAMERYLAKEISFSQIRLCKNSPKTRIIGKDFEDGPEIGKLYRIKDKTAFLMCTDGFWQNINESDIESTLKNTTSSREWLGKMLKTIEKATPASCGNLTAVAIIM